MFSQGKGEGGPRHVTQSRSVQRVFNNHAHFACDFVTFHFKITNTVIPQKNASDIPGGMGRDLNPGS